MEYITYGIHRLDMVFESADDKHLFDWLVDDVLGVTSLTIKSELPSMNLDIDLMVLNLMFLIEKLPII